jgi:penicillin-binding protein 2
VPTPTAEQAELVARKYLAAWMAGNFERMWELLAKADQVRVGHDAFIAIHRQFASLSRVTKLTALSGHPRPITLPTALPSTPPPRVSASPLASTTASPAPSSAASPSGGQGTALGPVPGMEVAASLIFQTDLFGEVRLQRNVVLVQGPSDWLVHWSPDLIFPELGADGALAGTFALTRQLGTRGRIIDRSGRVFAMMRSDGMRLYPQEWLAGQTIGYASKVTAEDLETLAAKGYRAGDWIGRSGLERGAEDLLRGTPGFTLSAKIPGREPATLVQTEMVPGATVTISLKADLQRAAEAAASRFPRVASAAVDPKSGEVWMLTSLPRFNPNAMTLGTTLRGARLPRPGSDQILNKAVVGTYPAGSDFKPFTLGAALQTKTVTTGTLMPCPSTWTYSGFRFKNWEFHSLPGLRPWTDSMAFSCNTTYMPLSVRVYERDKGALTKTLHDFGFGQNTGIPYLAEEPGVLPDASYFASHTRWNGVYSPYGPFDQIQLAIGQGDYRGTPLQLALAYAAWGNRGTLWRPRIVLKATLPGGKVVYESKPTIHHKIGLSRAVMDYVVTTMRAVVTSPLGTATRAFAGFPIKVAGKSGTAEDGVWPDAWFPAFAPVNNPSIAVATVVLNTREGTGGDVAAPITRRIMEAHFFR